MRFDYKLELNKIIENIYVELICNMAIKNKNLNFENTSIDEIKNHLVYEKVYLGSDMDEFILNNIPNNLDGDLFRCEIAKAHNRIHPRFVDYKGNPVKDSGYSRFAMLLWEEHINILLIEDVQRLFTQEGFINFVNNKLEYFIDEIINKINNHNLKAITIDFDKKEYLLNVVKNMICRDELPFDYAYMLVDMEKLREDMIKSAATFDMYNEFDKLQNETRYCLDNYPKYNTYELYDFLTNELCFNLEKEGILINKLH